MPSSLLPLLQRMTSALERLAPPPVPTPDLAAAHAFVWDAQREYLHPVPEVNTVPLALLQGVDEARDRLLANTRRFAAGLPANNALLWGARGTGKSSLVKAVHGQVVRETAEAPPALVELHREDLDALPRLLALLRHGERRCVLFCDDLSFDAHDTRYKALKAVLEGGLEGRPETVVFYATSNRRHLLAQEAGDTRYDPLHGGDSADEMVSLSDRFGLWLGFHHMGQDTYLAIVRTYAAAAGLSTDTLEADALEWAMTRGARSGRVAWQFIQDRAGAEGRPLAFRDPGPESAP